MPISFILNQLYFIALTKLVIFIYLEVFSQPDFHYFTLYIYFFYIFYNFILIIILRDFILNQFFLSNFSF